MLRFCLVFLALFVLLAEAQAKSPGFCDGAFAKAATVKSKPLAFTAKKLQCRSLRDGPKGFQLRCFGMPDVRVASDRIAEGLHSCLTTAGFTAAIQGKTERMKITELRDAKRGILCTMINSAAAAGVDGWSVKLKCYGPR